MRVCGYDLGVEGAVFRAERTDAGLIVPLSCETWKWPKDSDEVRYHRFSIIAEREVEWADAIAYEHVQFNRGKSSIEGLRALLLAAAHDKEIFCPGVNVSTLKSFALKGRWSDGERKKAGKKPLPGKKKMLMALTMDYPDFIPILMPFPGSKAREDLVDAAWVCIWLLHNLEVVDNG